MRIILQTETICKKQSEAVIKIIHFSCKVKNVSDTYDL